VDVTIWPVGEALSWTDTVEQRLAEVLLEGTESGTATRLALSAFTADEPIAEFFVSVRSAEEDVCVDGETVWV